MPYASLGRLGAPTRRPPGSAYETYRCNSAVLRHRCESQPPLFAVEAPYKRRYHSANPGIRPKDADRACRRQYHGQWAVRRVGKLESWRLSGRKMSHSSAADPEIRPKSAPTSRNTSEPTPLSCAAHVRGVVTGPRPVTTPLASSSPEEAYFFSSWYSLSVLTDQMFFLSARPDSMFLTASNAEAMEWSMLL